MQLRFASFAVINLRRDLHPQECAHAGRTSEKPPPSKLSGGFLITGRDGRIRTYDPLLPKQMRYQAALRPEEQNYSRFLTITSSTTTQRAPHASKLGCRAQSFVQIRHQAAESKHAYCL